MRTRTQGARAFIPAVLTAVLCFAIIPASPTSAADTDPDPSIPVPTETIDPGPTEVLDPAPIDAPSTDAPATDPDPDPTTPPTTPVITVPTPVVPKPAPAKPAARKKHRLTEAQRIVRVLRRQLGDRYRYGANGPRTFDCSGLVIYAYKKAGAGKIIRRGHLRSARALYTYFQRHHHASRRHPRVGDIVVWGRGSHVGVYIGGGRAISALTRGVRVHRIHAMRARFTTYLHTGTWHRAA